MCVCALGVATVELGGGRTVDQSVGRCCANDRTISYAGYMFSALSYPPLSRALHHRNRDDVIAVLGNANTLSPLCCGAYNKKTRCLLALPSILLQALVSDVRLSDGMVTLLLPHPRLSHASPGTGPTMEANDSYSKVIAEVLNCPPSSENARKKFTLNGWHARFKLERHGLQVH